MYHISIRQVITKQEQDMNWLKVADSGNKRDNGPQYEYVFADVTKEKDVEIYSQRVEALDLPSVIMAINSGASPVSLSKEELLDIRERLSEGTIDDPEDILAWFAEYGVALISEVLNYRSLHPLADR